MNSVRVLVADDHGIVRKGIRFLLEQEAGMDVVGEACDGREAVKLAETLAPQVIVMDVAMPQLNGIDATAQIVRRNPKIAVVILSMYSDEGYIMRALTAGVKGYLLKDATESDLVPAIRSVVEGRAYFSPAIAQVLAEDYTRHLQQKGLQDSYELLTEREKEILQLLAEGKSNKEVSALLNLSPYTVETHRTHIMQKLNLHNTAEIVLYAVRKKIIV
jgi:DNA-binding NarL/FixJ family response regulator